MRNFFNVSNQVILIIITFFVFVTITLRILPFELQFPSSGLDGSWSFAIDQAVAQGLAFGKDIIFTFGPYASLYTKLYHPATYVFLVLGSVVFLTGYLLALSRLISYGKKYTALGIALTLVLAYHVDSLFFSYLMLFLCIVYNEAESYKHLGKGKHPAKIVSTIFLLLPFGLLPLVKLSFALISFPILMLTILVWFIYKNRLLAVLTFIVPPLSLCIFWMLTHQSLSNIPAYFINNIDIVLGYSEAMSTMGRIIEPCLYALCAGGLLLAIIFNSTKNHLLKAYLFLSYSGLLFVIFKEGFVRHDWHALVAATSIMLAVISSSTFLKSKIVFFILLLASISTCYFITTDYQTYTLDQFKSFYINTIDGLGKTLTLKGDFSSTFNEYMKKIKTESSIPLLQGSTDIYSFDQSDLVASGNTWSPRPIFQSYSSYTKKLEELNYKSLIAHNAPENIVFQIQPIDSRLPALEDGISWPWLINNYSINQINNKRIFFKKNAVSEEVKLHLIGIHEYLLNETIPLQDNNQVIFAEIDVSLTLLGKLASFIYKTPSLEILMTLSNDQILKYRFIPKMAETGFILSPLIDNTRDFMLLNTAHWNKYLKGNKVKNFKIISNKKYLWQPKFVLKTSSIDIQGKTDIHKLHI